MGKHCINAHSLSHPPHLTCDQIQTGRLALHAQIMSHGDTGDRREDPIRGGQRSHYLPYSYSEALEKGCWKEKTPSMLA